MRMSNYKEIVAHTFEILLGRLDRRKEVLLLDASYYIIYNHCI